MDRMWPRTVKKENLDKVTKKAGMNPVVKIQRCSLAMQNDVNEKQNDVNEKPDDVDEKQNDIHEKQNDVDEKPPNVNKMQIVMANVETVRDESHEQAQKLNIDTSKIKVEHKQDFIKKEVPFQKKESNNNIAIVKSTPSTTCFQECRALRNFPNLQRLLSGSSVASHGSVSSVKTGGLVRSISTWGISKLSVRSALSSRSQSYAGPSKKLKMTPIVDIEKISTKKLKGPTLPPSTSTSSSSDKEEDDDPKHKVVYVQDAIDQFKAACKKFLPKDEAEPIVNKIQKHVNNLSPDFISCPRLKLVIEKNYSLLHSNRDDIYVYVKIVLDELKKRKKGTDIKVAQMFNNQFSPDQYEDGSSESSVSTGKISKSPVGSSFSSGSHFNAFGKKVKKESSESKKINEGLYGQQHKKVKKSEMKKDCDQGGDEGLHSERDMEIKKSEKIKDCDQSGDEGLNSKRDMEIKKSEKKKDSDQGGDEKLNSKRDMEIKKSEMKKDFDQGGDENLHSKQDMIFKKSEMKTDSDQGGDEELNSKRDMEIRKSKEGEDVIILPAMNKEDETVLEVSQSKMNEDPSIFRVKGSCNKDVNESSWKAGDQTIFEVRGGLERNPSTMKVQEQQSINKGMYKKHLSSVKNQIDEGRKIANQSTGRGMVHQSNERRIAHQFTGRGMLNQSSGRGLGHQFTRGGMVNQSSGEGMLNQSSGRGLGHQFTRGGMINQSSGEGMLNQSYGRGSGHQIMRGRIGKRMVNQSSGRRSGNQFTRGRMANKPSGRWIVDPFSGIKMADQSSGSGIVDQSTGRGMVGQSNGSGMVDQSTGRGMVGQSNRRGIVDQSTGRWVVGHSNGRVVAEGLTRETEMIYPGFATAREMVYPPTGMGMVGGLPIGTGIADPVLFTGQEMVDPPTRKASFVSNKTNVRRRRLPTGCGLGVIQPEMQTSKRVMLAPGNSREVPRKRSAENMRPPMGDVGLPRIRGGKRKSLPAFKGQGNMRTTNGEELMASNAGHQRISRNNNISSLNEGGRSKTQTSNLKQEDIEVVDLSDEESSPDDGSRISPVWESTPAFAKLTTCDVTVSQVQKKPQQQEMPSGVKLPPCISITRLPSNEASSSDQNNVPTPERIIKVLSETANPDSVPTKKVQLDLSDSQINVLKKFGWL